MTHHRDPPFHQEAHEGDDAPPALDLHRVHPRLEEGGGVVHRLGVGGVVGVEGHVPDEQAGGGATGDRPGVVEHLLHAHRQGARVAEHEHPQRVADEQDGDRGGVEDARCGVVVRGDDGEAAPMPLALREVVDADGPTVGGHGQPFARAPVSPESEAAARRERPRRRGRPRSSAPALASTAATASRPVPPAVRRVSAASSR